MFGPALAIASAPRTSLWSLISSSNCVARAAGAGALRAAALDHEVLDHPVEDQAVVEAVTASFLKFSTVFGASSSNSSIVMSP